MRDSGTSELALGQQVSYQLPAVLNSLLKQSVEPFAGRSPGQRTEATPTFVRMRHCALLQRPHLAMEVSKTAADNERRPPLRHKAGARGVPVIPCAAAPMVESC